MPYPSLRTPATFLGGDTGPWEVTGWHTVVGAPLPRVERIEVRAGLHAGPWALSGISGPTRYAERAEKLAMDLVPAPLGRPEATRAALIPIRKSADWWALAQDERRQIFEGQSGHIARSLPYLPRVARRLYHSADLGEPFDFLTWFEFAPEHVNAFDELLGILRAQPEWTFVDREVEIRLSR